MHQHTRRIIINTVSGSGARIAALGIVFVTTPVLINNLGQEAYGLYTIATALPAYAGLLDFGIGAGLVKHLTEYSSTNDKPGVRQVMTLSLLFYTLLGLLLAPVVFLFAPAIVRLLTIPESFRAAAEISVILMFAYFILSGIAGVYSARLVSLHRMDISAGFGLVGQIVFGVLIVILVPLAPDILTAVWLSFVPLAISGVLSYVLVRQIDGRSLCDPRTISGKLAKKLFAFGAWMQLNSLTALVNMEADKVIIAGYLNVSTVTPYQIGNRLASLNRLIPFQLLSALMPAATVIQVDSNQEEAKAFYRDMSRHLMLLTLAITGFTSVCAHLLIVTWIGEAYPQAVFVIWALGASFAVNNLTGGGTTMARAAGIPRYETYYAVLSMVLKIALTIVLAPLFGLVGIMGATIAANVIGSIYFIVIFHRRFAMPWYETMGVWLWRLLLATAVACAGLYGLQEWFGADPANRLHGIALVLVFGGAYLALLLVTLSLTGFWTPADMRVFRGVINRVVSRVSRSSRR
jgi:O-antigen/teichoic acid export membrane protein